MACGCVETTHPRDKDGYGIQWHQGKSQRAHRVAFFDAHGYWPKICRHTCDNPPCVNPEHLVDGSVTDNNRDAVERGRNANARKTHCSNGHAFTPENTYIYDHSDRPGSRRICKACSIDRVNKRAELERMGV